MRILIVEDEFKLADLIATRLKNSSNPQTFSETNLSKLIETKALSFESLMFERSLELKLNIEKDIILNCDPDRTTRDDISHP